MGRPVSVGEDFAGVFDWFRESAFRLETLDHYAMDYEEQAVQRFLAGEPRDTTYIAGWLERVTAAVYAGRRMQRVHVVTEPLSDYLRFEITGYRLNVEAGEDVRILPRRATADLDVADHDWLFDGRQVVLMHYDSGGAFLGAELSTTPVLRRAIAPGGTRPWVPRFPTTATWPSIARSCRRSSRPPKGRDCPAIG